MELIICNYLYAPRFYPIKPTLAFRIRDDHPVSVNNIGTDPLVNSKFYVCVKEYVLDDTDTDTILKKHPEQDTPENWARWKRGDYITPKMASIVLNDFKTYYKQAECFLIHCTAGASRSPAIAIALNEIFDLENDSEALKNKYPYNKLIYRKLKETAILEGF
jgi:hypothetical protein